MYKIIISILFMIISSNSLFASTEESNFKVLNSCLIDIQKKRDNLVDTYYTNLVFSEDVTIARKKVKAQLLKKVSLQIGATSILYYKHESVSRNNHYIKESTQKSFKQDIQSVPLELDLDSLLTKEFYCRSKGELFFLSAVNKNDVLRQTKHKLISISEENKQLYKQIKKEKNLLKKMFFLDSIQINYLPYLMILESAKKEKKLQSKYLTEMLFYQKKKKQFLNNVDFFIIIKAPENRVYTIEQRVDEARQEMIKYLAKYSIYAIAINNEKDLKKIIAKTKKNCGIISINLKTIKEMKLEEDLDTGSSFVNYLRLEFKLYNASNAKHWKNTGSYYINYNEYVPQWMIKPVLSMREHNQNDNILKRLAAQPIKANNFPKNNNNSKMVRDNGNGIILDTTTHLQWQDNEASPEMGWKNAKQYCEKLSLNGRGWRLPAVDELKTIVDLNKKNPSIVDEFLNTAAYYYWSGTKKDGLWYFDQYNRLSYLSTFNTSIIEKEKAFPVARYMNFAYGYEFFSNQKSLYRVRCVRDRQ